MMDVVALVPGFLGFDHRGDRTYFADRFIAGLRANLEARCGKPVPVVSVSTLPIGSLASRQKKLMDDLRTLDDRFGEPRWHLLGHSTGGLDATLLGRDRRLRYEPSRGSEFSDEKLAFDRLASVTTLAAPLWGTTLACAPVAALTHRMPTQVGIKELGAALFDLTQRDALLSRIEFAFGSIGSSGPLSLLHMFLGNELARDLQPDIAGTLVGTNNTRDTALISFATIAPSPSAADPDRFFADLWKWTAERAETAPLPPAFPANAPILNGPPPAVDGQSNDGVVNTMRQIQGTLGGLVVGDHGDVIGRYRRFDPLDQKVIDPGLLTSRANFGDDCFFQLLARMADELAKVIRA